MEEKYCKGCNTVKPLTTFYHPPSRGYPCHLCKTCMRQQDKSRIQKWAKQHPGQRRLNQQHYIGTMRGRYRRLKSSAIQRHKIWEFTLDEFIQWWNQRPFTCHYCGVPLLLQGKEPNSLTIDRVDNNLGYYLNNIVKCCYKCNTAKGDRKLLVTPAT